jgi:putative nucleotidyltransferase with HDIG domain
VGPVRRLLARLARSLTLLRLFVGASALILALGAIVLTHQLTASVRAQAIRDEIDSATVLADAVLSPAVVRGDRLAATTPNALRLGRSIKLPPEVRSLNAWSRDGTLLFTNVRPSRIGHRLPMDDGLESFFRTNDASASFIDLRHDVDERPTANGRPGHPREIDVYVPIAGASGRTLGAYEVYVESDRVDAVIAASTHTIWLTVGGVFAALFAALVLLTRGASRRMRQQTEALRAHSTELQRSNLLLEQSSLETIETLNATVEAKDPYTAGHSHRVRAVSLLIGRELGLVPERLDILGLGALFHDVGKIGVPDAILTKPGKLTAAEFETVKQHAVRGAEIVAHVSRLEDTVPLIRHHHERWDGFGYPDGLAAEAIPLEASIVGLADAWDAMTTARPYADALPLAAALEQVRAGRGTQFRPDVVDAFLAVAESSRLEAAGRATSLAALRPVWPVAATG